MLVISLFSCSDDYLDTTPTDSIASASAFTTTTNAWATLNGIHRMLYMQLRNQGEGGVGGIYINMDMLGEDVVMTSAGNGWYNNTYKWVDHRNANSSVNSYPYYTFYRIIANTNMILANINGAVGPDADKNAIKGQALAYRAWSHFMLVQLYGKRYVPNVVNSQLGVPLVLDNSIVGKPRATVEEVYTQVNKDLLDAIPLLTGYNRANKSHLNLNVVNGLRARVALTQGRWVDAATLAASARTGFTLMTNAVYRAGFNNYTNTEWMWGSFVQSDQTQFFFSFFAYMSRNFSSTNIRGNPKAVNTLLFNAFPATDVRTQVIDPTGLHTSLALAATFTRVPFTSQKFLAVDAADSRGDQPHMRAAEMILIEAEARARNNEDVLARTALQLLNINRNPSGVISTNSGQALIDEIMRHRRLELWGEGFRFLDLKRTNAALNRNGANHNVSLATEMTIPVGDPRWEWLIPQAEINANPLIVQN